MWFAGNKLHRFRNEATELVEGNKGVKYEPFILYKLQLVHHQEIVGLHDLYTSFGRMGTVDEEFRLITWDGTKALYLMG